LLGWRWSCTSFVFQVALSDPSAAPAYHIFIYDGQDHAGTAWNSLLTNFQELALRLKHAGSVLERRVEEMRNEYFS
jgi:hypothetical protein